MEYKKGQRVYVPSASLWSEFKNRKKPISGTIVKTDGCERIFVRLSYQKEFVELYHNEVLPYDKTSLEHMKKMKWSVFRAT